MLFRSQVRHFAAGLSFNTIGGHTLDRDFVDLVQRTLAPLGAAQFALSASDRERLATRFSNTEAAELRAEASRKAPVRPAAAADATITPITWVDAPPAPSRLRAPR